MHKDKFALDIVILTSGKVHAVDKNVGKLIKFYGLNVDIVLVNTYHDIINCLRYFSCLMINVASCGPVFSDIFEQYRLYSDQSLDSKIIFLYNISSGLACFKALQHLTFEVFNAATAFDMNNYEYNITKEFPDICRQFSGLQFGPINKDINFGLLSSKEQKVIKIINIHEHHFFSLIDIKNYKIFVYACNDIIDIDTEVTGAFRCREYFSQFIPVLMFIKYVFGDRCWHTEKTFANLTIDDPLLKKRYGFVDYQLLVDAMKKSNFATTIAFIPLNYKRTDTDVAKIFQKKKDRLSICVHGMDHTKAEFSQTDEGALNARVIAATEHMEEHQRCYGVPYDKVMIFPQGVFSSAAMKVLSCNNYIAALNTDYRATDTEKFGSLRVSDFLDSALTNYHGFPLFLRRYPVDIVDFTFDAFLGKPLIIVEHHVFFKKGYTAVSAFIDKINAINEPMHEEICWGNLEKIFCNLYLKRRGRDGSFYCRLYANRTLIRNNCSTELTFIIEKKVSCATPVEKILVNGCEQPYSLNNDTIELTLTVPGNGSVEIKNYFKTLDECGYYGRTPFQTAKIYMRRYLSEFRDNYLSKNESVLLVAKALKNKLPF